MALNVQQALMGQTSARTQVAQSLGIKTSQVSPSIGAQKAAARNTNTTPPSVRILSTGGSSGGGRTSTSASRQEDEIRTRTTDKGITIYTFTYTNPNGVKIIVETITEPRIYIEQHGGGTFQGNQIAARNAADVQREYNAEKQLQWQKYQEQTTQLRKQYEQEIQRLKEIKEREGQNWTAIEEANYQKYLQEYKTKFSGKESQIQEQWNKLNQEQQKLITLQKTKELEQAKQAAIRKQQLITRAGQNASLSRITQIQNKANKEIQEKAQKATKELQDYFAGEEYKKWQQEQIEKEINPQIKEIETEAKPLQDQYNTQLQNAFGSSSYKNAWQQYEDEIQRRNYDMAYTKAQYENEIKRIDATYYPEKYSINNVYADIGGTMTRGSYNPVTAVFTADNGIKISTGTYYTPKIDIKIPEPKQQQRNVSINKTYENIGVPFAPGDQQIKWKLENYEKENKKNEKKIESMTASEIKVQLNDLSKDYKKKIKKFEDNWQNYYDKESGKYLLKTEDDVYNFDIESGKLAIDATTIENYTKTLQDRLGGKWRTTQDTINYENAGDYKWQLKNLPKTVDIMNYDVDALPKTINKIQLTPTLNKDYYANLLDQANKEEVDEYTKKSTFQVINESPGITIIKKKNELGEELDLENVQDYYNKYKDVTKEPDTGYSPAIKWLEDQGKLIDDRIKASDMTKRLAEIQTGYEGSDAKKQIDWLKEQPITKVGTKPISLAKDIWEGIKKVPEIEISPYKQTDEEKRNTKIPSYKIKNIGDTAHAVTVAGVGMVLENADKGFAKAGLYETPVAERDLNNPIWVGKGKNFITNLTEATAMAEETVPYLVTGAGAGKIILTKATFDTITGNPEAIVMAIPVGMTFEGATRLTARYAAEAGERLAIYADKTANITGKLAGSTAKTMSWAANSTKYAMPAYFAGTSATTGWEMGNLKNSGQNQEAENLRRDYFSSVVGMMAGAPIGEKAVQKGLASQGLENMQLRIRKGLAQESAGRIFEEVILRGYSKNGIVKGDTTLSRVNSTMHPTMRGVNRKTVSQGGGADPGAGKGNTGLEFTKTPKGSQIDEVSSAIAQGATASTGKGPTAYSKVKDFFTNPKKAILRQIKAGDYDFVNLYGHENLLKRMVKSIEENGYIQEKDVIELERIGQQQADYTGRPTLITHPKMQSKGFVGVQENQVLLKIPKKYTTEVKRPTEEHLTKTKQTRIQRLKNKILRKKELAEAPTEFDTDYYFKPTTSETTGYSTDFAVPIRRIRFSEAPKIAEMGKQPELKTTQETALKPRENQLTVPEQKMLNGPTAKVIDMATKKGAFDKIKIKDEYKKAKEFNKNYHETQLDDWANQMTHKLRQMRGQKLVFKDEYGKHFTEHATNVEKNMFSEAQKAKYNLKKADAQMISEGHDTIKRTDAEGWEHHGPAAAETMAKRAGKFKEFWPNVTPTDWIANVKAIGEHEAIKPKRAIIRGPKEIPGIIRGTFSDIKGKLIANADRLDLTRFGPKSKPDKWRMFDLKKADTKIKGKNKRIAVETRTDLITKMDLLAKQGITTEDILKSLQKTDNDLYVALKTRKYYLKDNEYKANYGYKTNYNYEPKGYDYKEEDYEYKTNYDYEGKPYDYKTNYDYEGKPYDYKGNYEYKSSYDYGEGYGYNTPPYEPPTTTPKTILLPQENQKLDGYKPVVYLNGQKIVVKELYPTKRMAELRTMDLLDKYAYTEGEVKEAQGNAYTRQKINKIHNKKFMTRGKRIYEKKQYWHDYGKENEGGLRTMMARRNSKI